MNVHPLNASLRVSVSGQCMAGCTWGDSTHCFLISRIRGPCVVSRKRGSLTCPGAAGASGWVDPSANLTSLVLTVELGEDTYLVRDVFVKVPRIVVRRQLGDVGRSLLVQVYSSAPRAGRCRG